MSVHVVVTGEAFAFTPDNEAWAKKQIDKYPAGRQASAVMPLLWRAQAQRGGWLMGQTHFPRSGCRGPSFETPASRAPQDEDWYRNSTSSSC